MAKKVSIIILTYNGKDLVAKNLPSVINNTDLAQHEIIVVDNGSTDDTMLFIKASFPQVKVVRIDKNIGFSHGCNIGAKASSGDYLYFLNNDMEATSNYLDPLITHFLDSSVFAVVSKILRPSQNMINESITMAHFAGGSVNPDNLISRKMPEPTGPIEIMYACGGGMLCNKQIFFALGGFEELYCPFYWEDFDLSYQAWKQGYRVIYEPASLIYHQHNKTTKKYWSSNFLLTYYIRNRYVFIWKNITSIPMLASHVFQLVIPKIIIPNIYEWTGFFKAIQILPKIIKKRKALIPKAKLTDEEVLGKFKDWVKYL